MLLPIHRFLLISALFLVCMSTAWASIAGCPSTYTYTIGTMSFVPSSFFSYCNMTNPTSGLAAQDFDYGGSVTAMPALKVTLSTDAILHPIDATMPDPATWYWYNPNLQLPSTLIVHKVSGSTAATAQMFTFISEYGSVSRNNQNCYNIDCTIYFLTQNSTHIKIIVHDNSGNTTQYLTWYSGGVVSNKLGITYHINAAADTFTLTWAAGKVPYATSFYNPGATPTVAFSTTLLNSYPQFTMIDSTGAIVKIKSHLTTTKQYLVSLPSAPSYPAAICRSYVYGNNQLIIPQITFAATENFVQADWYDAGGWSYLIKDKSHYVLDQNNLWWLVPAQTCAAVTDAPTLVAAVYAGTLASGTGTSGTFLVPPAISTNSACYSNGTHYITQDSFSTSHSYEILKTYCAGTYYPNNDTCTGTVTNSSATTSGNTFYAATSESATNLSKINYILDSASKCEWRNGQTSLLGLNALTFTNYWQGIPDFIFYALIGVSILMPYFIVAAIAWNDIFLVMPVGYMTFAIIAIAFVSIMVNWGGNRSTKIIFMITIACLYLVVNIYMLAGQTAPAAITGLTSTLSTTYASMSTMTLDSFVLSVPGLLISIFGFILGLPIILGDVINTLMAQISAPIAGAFYGLTIVIGYSTYGYVLLKAYQILANRFPDV